jgi:hypothetical protein
MSVGCFYEQNFETKSSNYGEYDRGVLVPLSESEWGNENRKCLLFLSYCLPLSSSAHSVSAFETKHPTISCLLYRQIWEEVCFGQGRCHRLNETCDIICRNYKLKIFVTFQQRATSVTMEIHRDMNYLFVFFSETQHKKKTSNNRRSMYLWVACGRRLKYLHRNPASRRRRRKGIPVPGGITGPQCYGEHKKRHDLPGWGLDARLTTFLCKNKYCCENQRSEPHFLRKAMTDTRTAVLPMMIMFLIMFILVRHTYRH